MALGTKSREPGRNHSRSTRYIQRMDKLTQLVEATFRPWTPVPTEFRRVILAAAMVVGLQVTGLLSWIMRVIQ
jgi:hypothetical protein